MFNGIITDFNSIIFLKYFIKNNFFILKLNKKLFNFNIGDSISLQGICLTLIYKSILFFEFEFCYGTFLNTGFLKSLFFNIEKSINLFSLINGHFIYCHINNIFFLKNKIFNIKNILKLYILIPIFYKEFLNYKFSICLNGLSLTLNEFFFYNKFIIVSINILYYTYFFTNLKFFKNFDIINIEFDYSILFLLKKYIL